MEVFLYLVGVIIALGAGYYLGQNFSNPAKEKNRLQTELDEKQQELDSLKNRVNQHFETTASLFNQVSDSYQQLYDHMAKSSTQLCTTQNFQATLPVSGEVSDSNEQLPENFDSIHKTNTDANDLFDANNLYKAHSYRNQEQKEDQEAKETNTPDDKQERSEEANQEDMSKEQSSTAPNRPAKDYAVKD